MKRVRDETKPNPPLIIGPFVWAREREIRVWDVNDHCGKLHGGYCNEATIDICARTASISFCRPFQHRDVLLRGRDIFLLEQSSTVNKSFIGHELTSGPDLSTALIPEHLYCEELEIVLSNYFFGCELIEAPLKHQKERDEHRDKCYTFVHCLLHRMGLYKDLRRMIARMVFETK